MTEVRETDAQKAARSAGVLALQNTYGVHGEHSRHRQSAWKEARPGTGYWNWVLDRLEVEAQALSELQKQRPANPITSATLAAEEEEEDAVAAKASEADLYIYKNPFPKKAPYLSIQEGSKAVSEDGVVIGTVKGIDLDRIVVLIPTERLEALLNKRKNNA